MSTTDYIIKLSDNRTLLLSPDKANFYPLIRDMLDMIDTQPGGEIPLFYRDSDALYTLLTTTNWNISKDPQMYMRLINAMDYMGHEQMMDIMLAQVVHWLAHPEILADPAASQQVIGELTDGPYQRLMMFIERREKGWPMIPIHERKRAL